MALIFTSQRGQQAGCAVEVPSSVLLDPPRTIPDVNRRRKPTIA
jgi:hypothetical protein